MPNRRLRTTVAVALLGLAAGLAGCSTGGTGVATVRGATTTTSASAGFDQAFLSYTRCMRAHGVAMSDPVHRPGHSGLTLELPQPTTANAAARQACAHILAPVQAAKEAGAQQEVARWLPHLVDYARCMRAHDISMPDPGPDGQLNLGPVPGMTSSYGRYSPQFHAADAACRHLLPAGVRDNGTGP
jgi:hypothetical protein